MNYPNIFINRMISDENNLCLYIRELDKNVEGVRIRMKGQEWIELIITQKGDKTETITFSNLEPQKFYTFEGQIKVSDNWEYVPNATFAPSFKIPNKKIDVIQLKQNASLNNKKRTIKKEPQLVKVVNVREVISI